MDLKGEQLINLDREAVWNGLNEPDILKVSIPGCESIEKTDEGDYKLVMLLAVGPVKARFNGKLMLSDIRPPESYTLTFEGSGGVAGFGKGKADVALAAVEEGTLLSYQVNAQVGGKIAQVGSRLIDGVASRMAVEFFTRFKAALVPPAPSAEPEEGAEGAAQESKKSWKFWGNNP